jgi:predicted alpha/beta hydrolase family esterase
MAKAVYTAQPQYERVIIVGHSLGSVIVYGTLNRLINGNLTGEKRTWV